ncbi:MAG: hypothetical protein EAZ97_01135 [Bacteroidetes bacterium]|nr:MAG: hypothetical protein EAZ97_01135 [Bacteroidota bacterium]
MLIANPIYDVVFKYLMQDNKVAKLLISSIIDMEVIDLDFQPQEFTANFSTEKSAEKKQHKTKKSKKTIPPEVYLSIYRLDFKARVLTPEGEKLIIIEIQKAKYMSEIMRFRRYLGEQYANENNAYDFQTKKGLMIKKGVPIISIYFLGEQFEHISGVPIVKINNQVIDLYSGKELAVKEDFIESLTHKCFIISIPNLKKRRRNELEMLLSIFDQSNRSEHHHILNISEHDFPEKYRQIIRRLQKAQSENELRKQMTLEDDIQEQLDNIWRKAAEDAEKIAAQEEIIEEKEKALLEKDKVFQEQQELIRKLQEEIEKMKNKS